MMVSVVVSSVPRFDALPTAPPPAMNSVSSVEPDAFDTKPMPNSLKPIWLPMKLVAAQVGGIVVDTLNSLLAPRPDWSTNSTQAVALRSTDIENGW